MMASGTVLPLVFSERKHPAQRARRRAHIKAQKAPCAMVVERRCGLLLQFDCFAEQTISDINFAAATRA
jgi:hypothetical protein